MVLPPFKIVLKFRSDEAETFPYEGNRALQLQTRPGRPWKCVVSE